jgi:RNA ligase (TIGR02306 family)
MENERKLATIRRIKEITPIEGADKIELCHIDGWQCVSQKGNFEVNSLAVFFEIDSLLPIKEPFLFLESRGRKKLDDGTEGYRLRTIKLKGVLSQGLLLPLLDFVNDLPEMDLQTIKENKDSFVGVDLTESLGIKKYEPPVPAQLRGHVKGSFPSFLRRTDEERIQNLPDYFTKYEDEYFEETEKLDGTSSTYFLNNGEFGICSRNINFKITDENNDNTYFQMEKKYNIKETLEKIGKNLSIQGEICGPGIQKNRLGLKEVCLYIFKIYDIDLQRYLTNPEKDEYMDKYFSHIPHVPLLGLVKIFKEYPTMDSILEHVKGKSILNKDKKREGCVYKSCNTFYNQVISFKVINNQYLLDEE